MRARITRDLFFGATKWLRLSSQPLFVSMCRHVQACARLCTPDRSPYGTRFRTSTAEIAPFAHSRNTSPPPNSLEADCRPCPPSIYPVESATVVEHLSFGLSSQYQLGLLDGEWKIGSCGWRVEADGSTQLGIPKVRIVDSSGPRSFHHTYETVLTFNCGFLAVPSKDQNLGIT
jgi:hypothetical protein